MLPSEHRLRTPSEFRTAVRRGRRGTSRTMVVHLVRAVASGDTSPALPPAPPRVGFVVSRGVGGAVVRNRVRRRLRHLVATRVGSLASGDLLVVRALPAAAGAAELGSDLDRCLHRCLDRVRS